jgi:hypothetical protein
VTPLPLPPPVDVDSSCLVRITYIYTIILSEFLSIFFFSLRDNIT